MFFEHIATKLILIALSIFFVRDNIKRLYMDYEACSAEIKEARDYAAMAGATTWYVIIAVVLTVGYLFCGFMTISIEFNLPVLTRWYCLGVILAAKLSNLALEHFVFEGMEYTKNQFINDKMHTLLNVALAIFVGGMVLTALVFDYTM